MSHKIRPCPHDVSLIVIINLTEMKVLGFWDSRILPGTPLFSQMRKTTHRTNLGLCSSAVPNRDWNSSVLIFYPQFKTVFFFHTGLPPFHISHVHFSTGFGEMVVTGWLPPLTSALGAGLLWAEWGISTAGPRLTLLPFTFHYVWSTPRADGFKSWKEADDPQHTVCHMRFHESVQHASGHVMPGPARVKEGLYCPISLSLCSVHMKNATVTSVSLVSNPSTLLYSSWWAYPEEFAQLFSVCLDYLHVRHCVMSYMHLTISYSLPTKILLLAHFTDEETVLVRLSNLWVTCTGSLSQ